MPPSRKPLFDPPGELWLNGSEMLQSCGRSSVVHDASLNVVVCALATSPRLNFQPLLKLVPRSPLCAGVSVPAGGVLPPVPPPPVPPAPAWEPPAPAAAPPRPLDPPVPVDPLLPLLPLLPLPPATPTAPPEPVAPPPLPPAPVTEPPLPFPAAPDPVVPALPLAPAAPLVPPPALVPPAPGDPDDPPPHDAAPAAIATAHADSKVIDRLVFAAFIRSCHYCSVGVLQVTHVVRFVLYESRATFVFAVLLSRNLSTKAWTSGD